MLLASPETLQQAADYVSEHDTLLRPIIAAHGRCLIAPQTDYYGSLVSSIIGQQLSVKAAQVIRTRFLGLFDGHLPTPQQILAVSLETMRGVGLSYAKGRSVQDLAAHIMSGRLSFAHIPDQSNQTIISELCDVTGIGEWTAHMFLLFCVGRLDVLPYGDLGIRNGIRAIYGLATLPSPADVISIAEQRHWHPYESVASWYIWRSLDVIPTNH
jgi:DNA-3-methyladenine glycosylase II